MAQRSDTPLPPAPREIRHRVTLPARQWVALALIAAIPVLALFGVFGVTREQGQAQAGALRLEADYPARLRHKTLDRIGLTITNTGAAAIDSAELAIDTAYLAHFSDVTVTPAPPEQAFVIPLRRLAAGERRSVAVQVRAEGPGRHRGTVELRLAGGAAAALPISTFVFP